MGCDEGGDNLPTFIAGSKKVTSKAGKVVVQLANF